ncbi:MAG: phospholipase D-like domain-containing protein [Burkholderiales bacterium]
MTGYRPQIDQDWRHPDGPTRNSAAAPQQTLGQREHWTAYAREQQTPALWFFTEGDDLYEAMLSEIRASTQTVSMESYIFASDEIGWRFAVALGERAAAGVEVRLHLDAAGALGRWSASLQRHLRDRGVDVRWFQRWSWRHPLRYNRRSHRKLLIVDRHAAFGGGFNIHRESSMAAIGVSRWRDTHAELSGPLVDEATQSFDAFWRGRRQSPPIRSSGTQFVSNETRKCRHRIRCLYGEVFDAARQRIYVTTPYFVPDLSTLRRLVAAARRGVDVRVLVPLHSDVPVTQWAARAIYAALMSAGVHIHEYLPRMLHAKTVVVDSDWAALGTANLDYRSFFVNYELILMTTSPADCEQLVGHFFHDLSESRRLDAATFAARPWTNKLLEVAGHALRRWL